MLIICLRIFVVCQQNKLFVIHEQKGAQYGIYLVSRKQREIFVTHFC